jgi:hypothetical protein
MLLWRKILLIILLLSQRSLLAYSVQTHEQLIDLNWKNVIKPFLLHRSPERPELNWSGRMLMLTAAARFRILAIIRSPMSFSVT